MFFLEELSVGYSYLPDDMKGIFVIAGIFFFIVGSVIGSFLNVLIYRIPGGISEISKSCTFKGRSRCPHCEMTLKPLDLIPILSWIFLRGKCRYCKNGISPRYILVELATGISFLFAFITLGINWRLLITILLFSVLIILSVIDIVKMEIPYWCSGFIAFLGLICFVLSFINPSFYGSFWYEHLIGAVIIALPFAVLAYLGAMGGGDIQLVAAAGFLIGWAIVPSTLIALVTGAVFGVFVKVIKKSGRISFGPFLALGIAAGTLWGIDILNWYLRLLKY